MQAHERLYQDEYGYLVPFAVIEQRQQEQGAHEREAMRRREQVRALREERDQYQATLVGLRQSESDRLQKERQDRKRQWECAEMRRAERAERKAARAAEKEAREQRLLASYERIRSLGGFQCVEDKPSSDEEEDEGENGDDENVGGGGVGGGNEDDEECPANITPAMWRQWEFRGEPMANPCEGCKDRGIACVAHANPKSCGAHVCWGCATRHKTCNPVDKTVPVNQKGRRTKNRHVSGQSEVVRSEVAENAENAGTTNVPTSQVQELGNLTGRIEEVKDVLVDLKDKEEGTEERVSELVTEVTGLKKAVASMQAALSVEFVTLAERVKTMMECFGGLAEGSGVGLKRKREESSEEEDEDEDEDEKDKDAANAVEIIHYDMGGSPRLVAL
ncbi:hypothetical protein ONZ45_g12165 [Pleurotus djamor]|nr:hypothetical protein ONZ45_g12165 [Pleurotus djamor]